MRQKYIIYVTADTDYENGTSGIPYCQTDQQLADEVKKVMDDATKQGYDQVKRKCSG